ncbi:MAG TPA: hypothetical protein VE136_08920 [Anaerolineales bacterium]|nr:hypothetical protein [Anaerolineales bacterium]
MRATRSKAWRIIGVILVLVMAGCQPAPERPSTPAVAQPSATVAQLAATLKPADSDTPAAGICADSQYDPVSIVLGSGPDGMPLGGRCIAVNTTQRILLINQTGSQVNFQFAGFNIDLPVGGELLLDKPAGDYLATGVHHLAMGPEVWVQANPPP